MSTRQRRAMRGAARDAVLEVNDLTVRAIDGTVILDEISFTVQRGTVVAVVGPTGAGKTTLLNALTGRLRVQGGSIRVNGEELADNELLRRRLGYVPQDDVLHPQLTLRQTLEHAAALRLPSDVTATQRAERVSAVLTELGLEERSHLAVSSLSGGQRKRASVAVELLSQPEVLVLDEPTSGLDPGREKSVLESLRKLADLGHTVLTVTHSPQALAECDRVLFLAPGGHMAFFGPPAAAIEYFGHANAADVFLALGTTPGDAWKERFRAHPLHARYVPRHNRPGLHSVDDEGDESRATTAAAPVRSLPRWTAQLRTLVRRCFDVMRSDRRHVMLLALQGPILGALLCSTLISDSFRPLGKGVAAALSSQHALDQISAALFVALSVTWLGTANAVREIVKEQRTLLREEGTGLSLRAYVSSKVVVLGSVAMAQSAVLAVVATARQGVPGHGAVLPSGMLEIAFIGALGGLSAVAIGLMLSALVTTPDKALTVLPISLVGQLVFSGAWVQLDGPIFRQVRDLSSVHWIVHAIHSTANHDAGDWWISVVALSLITASAMVGTLALVQRRVLPTQLGEAKAKLGFRMTAGLRPGVVAAAGIALALAITTLAGNTSDFVPRAKLLGVFNHAAHPVTPAEPSPITIRVANASSPEATAPAIVAAAVPAAAGAGTAIDASGARSSSSTPAPPSTSSDGWITTDNSLPAPAGAAPTAAAPTASEPTVTPAAAQAPTAPAATTGGSTSSSSTSSSDAARQAAWRQMMAEAAARQRQRDQQRSTSTTPTTIGSRN